LEHQQAILEADDLHVNYGKSEILRGVSFHVMRGEIVSLIGANGSGKTTLLKAITGHKPPVSGRVQFEGKRIDGMVAHEVARIGIAHVLEGRRVFPELTVVENLKAGSHIIKNKQKAELTKNEVLEFFPILKERLRQKAGTLSGGEQKMLLVGRALMMKPLLLLMDEPSAGLAPLMVQEIGRIIKLINKEAISIFLVEQNSYLAFNTSQRTYVMETGTISLEGPSEELIKDERVRKAYLSA
jgi:branched-chain amino acid transport system ATP-binding protein